MCEAQRGKISVLSGKLRQAGDHSAELGQENVQAVSENDQVGVVANVAGGGSEVDDGSSLGRRHCEGVNVSHHVVPHLPLLLRGQLEVNIVDVVPHLRQLGAGDVQPQLSLRLGQPQPELPPGGEFLLVREVELHLLRGVARVERGLVTVSRHLECLKEMRGETR